MAKTGRNRQVLFKLFKAQNGICFICGMPMLKPEPLPPLKGTKAPGKRGRSSKYTATLDHVRPLHAGGKFAGNVKAAHQYCNSARGHLEPRSECINWMIDRIKKLQTLPASPFYLGKDSENTPAT